MVVKDKRVLKPNVFKDLQTQVLCLKGTGVIAGTKSVVGGWSEEGSRGVGIWVDGEQDYRWYNRRD